MWSSTVGLINGKHRYLTAETFGFKINSNGQQLRRKQQWTIEPFPENLGPDDSISSAASVSSQCPAFQVPPNSPPSDPSDPRILTLIPAAMGISLTSVKSSSNGSSNSDQDSCNEEHENVAIKSHLNKYLAVDSFGNVTCDSEEKTENARFTITICSMSQGRSKEEHIFWAFKNVERGYYLGASDDGMICCNAKVPKSRAELWHVHLLPARGASFFALKSLGRKRFARVSRDLHEGGKPQVQLDATISWGQETLFQFKYHEGGLYSLLTSDNHYLTNEGKCIECPKVNNEVAQPPTECLFTLEYHSGYIAFRDSFCHYLAAAGRSSVLRARSAGVSRDELFVFDSAPIQVSLKATFNNRWVSIKQGIDLSANQTETTSKYEVFQMTYHKQTKNWSIMTQDCNFWTTSKSTNTISVCSPGDYEALTRGQFRLAWSDTDATFSIKFVESNGTERWISARKSGQLYLPGGDHEPVKFIMRFQNRRHLNLRPVEGNGFVGIKGNNNKQLEANKTSPDTIAIEYPELQIPFVGSSDQIQMQNVTKRQHLGNDVEVGIRGANIFNVKLNSVRNGISNLEKCSDNNIDDIKKSTANSATKHSFEEPAIFDAIKSSTTLDGNEFDCGSDVVDDNNNNSENVADKNEPTNGSVEVAPAPSVSAIISSFSNIKVSSTKQQASGEQKQQISSNQPRVGASVSKLTSSFESNCLGQAQVQNDTTDTASVITSYSGASASSSIGSNSSGTVECSNGSIVKSSMADHVAQSECCYMKICSNDKYLVIGDAQDRGIICDATNKACAQAWIIELRSHDTIAIRASDNHAYMQLGPNGTISLSRCEPKDASLWEF